MCTVKVLRDETQTGGRGGGKISKQRVWIMTHRLDGIEIQAPLTHFPQRTMINNRGEAFTPLLCSETEAMQAEDGDACQRMTGKMGLKGENRKWFCEWHTWKQRLGNEPYQAGRWSLCWERQPQMGPQVAGRLLQAARAEYNPDFCRCCI